MKRKVRLVSITLQISAVADDGETLEPLHLKPVTVTAKDWETFSVGELLVTLEKQLDAESDQEPAQASG